MKIEITVMLESDKLASDLVKYAKPLIGTKGDWFELVYVDKVKTRREREWDGRMALLKERDSVCFRFESAKATIGYLLNSCIGSWLDGKSYSIDQPHHEMREPGRLANRMLLPGTKIVGIYYDSNFPTLGDIASGYIYTKKGATNE